MIKNETTRLSPKRVFLCLNQDMKMKFEGNIEFSITSGDWKATSQLPVIVYARVYSGVFAVCVMHMSLGCSCC